MAAPKKGVPPLCPQVQVAVTQITETGVTLTEQRVPLGWTCLAAVPFLSNSGLGGPKIDGPGTSACPGSGVSGCLSVRENEPAFFRGAGSPRG